ncbi:MAG: peptidylprolyl isomerase [Oligoflexus sp.]
MIQKYLYISLAILFFGLGMYGWKMTNTSLYYPGTVDAEDYSQLLDIHNILFVGKETITQDDIEWEFDMHTRGLLENEDLNHVPESVNNHDVMLGALKERLMADLIERKLLYQYIKMDANFNLTDPSLYTDCLNQWQSTLEESVEWFQSPESRMRLKNRLCERSIIMHYLENFIFSKIRVKDQEVEDYYNANSSEFEEPAKVKIRQIVLASEREARRIRYQVTAGNFEAMAREHSITPEAENGGILGPFALGEMPRVFDVAFTMRKGEIRGILKSTYGFHIIRIEDKKPRSKLTLEEAKPSIIAKLTQKKQDEEYQKWVEMALNEIPVKSPRPH